MGDLRLSLALLLAAAVAAPVAAGAQGDVPAGTYEGSAKGVKASLIVDELGDGDMRYSLKTPCGKSKGTIALDRRPGGSLKGSRARARTSVVVKVKADGNELNGTIKQVTKSKPNGSIGKCRAKRTFTVSIDASTSPQVQALAGHYDGSGQDGGLPVSFDVGYDEKAGALEITNLAFQTDTECWEDLDEDGADDTLVVKVSGLAGEVGSDGSFAIDHSPDDESAFYVEGVLEAGEAVMDIEVGGSFAADGTPLSGGPYECDSWGEVYTAARQG